MASDYISHNAHGQKVLARRRELIDKSDVGLSECSWHCRHPLSRIPFPSRNFTDMPLSVYIFKNLPPKAAAIVCSYLFPD